MKLLNEIFLIKWKKILTVIVAWAVAVLLHELIKYYFNEQEPFMFIIAVVIIPIYLVICLFYSIYHYQGKLKINDKSKKNEANNSN